MKRSLRIALLLASGSLLRIAIVLLIVFGTVVTLFAQRSYIYGLMESVKAYDRLPLIILNASSEQQLGQSEDTKLGSEVFAPIILEATPPEVTQLATKSIVDGYYDWLEGRSPKVLFKIDLSSSKDAIVDGITQYTINRYKLLPECTEVITGFDIFSVPCQVMGLDVDAQETSLRTQLENTPLLLRDTTYTQDTLLTDASGRQLDQTMPWLQSVYKNRSIILVGLIFIVLILITINLVGASHLVKGLRRVGKLMVQATSGYLITALFLFVILPIAGFSTGLVPREISTVLPSSWPERTYDKLFNDIVAHIAQDFVLRSLLWSLPFAIIGAAMWLYGAYQLEKHRQTGASLVSKLFTVTLESTGLVSSEEKQRASKTSKKYRLPLVSSDEMRNNKKQKRSYKRRSKKRSSK